MPIPVTRAPRRWPAFLSVQTTPPPDLPTTAGGLLRALTRMSVPAIACGVVVSAVAYLAQALIPLALGDLLDAGLEAGLTARLLPGLLALAGLGLLGSLAAGLEDATGMGAWASAWKPAMRGAAHRLGLRSRAVTRKIASGDVVATIDADTDNIGALMYFVVNVIGALISVVAVGVLMLRASTALGLLVLIGLPIVLALVGAFVRPLNRRLSAQREGQGRLSTITTDAVAGLRVLRGIGGEDVYSARYTEASHRVRDAGIRVASTQALLATVRAGAPMVFTAVVVGAGARAALAGAITPGQLVTFYGYTTFLVGPLGVMAELIQFSTRAWVGARKVARIEAVAPLTDDSGVVPGARLDPAGDLVDLSSGVVLCGGCMTALVCADPARAAALAQRLGRADDADGLVTLGGTALRAVPLEEVRRTIVVSGAHAEAFAGTLAEELLGDEIPLSGPRQTADVIRSGAVAGAHGDAGPAAGGGAAPLTAAQRERAEHALAVAAAGDALDSLGGLDGQLTEKARNVSGGQRQRLALARAVARRAPVLVLVEPTSALDSHTEDLVARRLREDRRGLTTVVVTASPLLLGRCDEVVLLAPVGADAEPDGEADAAGAAASKGTTIPAADVRELARGTHHELSGMEAYRAVVERGVEAGGKR
ncbi:ABC transporter transmembrane domain-containing protein [Actinomyces ruminicola]|uniref:ABC-type multidrug transport system, ATPase and permease component n=1 Tax=Actinomyces ruminicola TaxID=332524 RepID=A0A1G9WW66_9ACTO|nr:ABC transporter ATP-binding protein [Actinomyces ruminicola]SDM88717.1 ABC-type multidrug transport system, ATPase and permease component [Actinomyces ruminicola]